MKTLVWMEASDTYFDKCIHLWFLASAVPKFNHMQCLLIRACEFNCPFIECDSWSQMQYAHQIISQLQTHITTCVLFNPCRLLTTFLPVMDSAAYSHTQQLWLHSHQHSESLHLDTRGHQSNTQHYTPTSPVQALSYSKHYSEPVLSLCQVHMLLQSILQYVLLQVWKNTVFSVPSAGIPLDLDNSNGRTFPYLGQSDYR